jgi:serine-type D-Ala-D-Ala carboxypeptidase (penicillin-binding protein 5/6)
MKAILALLMSTLLTFSTFPLHHTFAKQENQGKSILDTVKSAIVIEKDTGKVLLQKDANKELPPASMTKIMTLLLIFKALDNHDISLSDKVKVSEHAASMGGSQIYLEPGEEMSVNDLLKAIAIGSANDASMAMAEYIAGTEDDFVKEMNDEAKALGLKHTHFSNPTGLPEDNHYSTALDMALMAKALLQYQDVLKYTSTYEAYLRENTDNKFWLVNTNKLLKAYPGVDGLKTGFTQEAKYCLTATAKRDGMRVIAVVMGAPTSKERNHQVSQLLSYAFANYKTKLILAQGKMVKKVAISKSEKGMVPIVTQQPVVVLMKKGGKQQSTQFKTKVEVKSSLKAPIKKGTVVGQYVVSDGNHVLTKTPLIVNSDIKKATFWQLIKRSVGKMTIWSR